jgi:4-diphosphocytidyl-2-C-methyl-D-erythritol kinase
MIELFSPAKINFFFKLAGKRADGYHNVESMFQAIDLFDKISLKFSSHDCFKSNTCLGFNEDNFIIKALFVFRQKTGLNHPLEITLEKKIPIEAGLGGGSSNASTILWGLNEIYDRPVSLDELQSFSSLVTSDSPFFFSEGTAFCTQRGEKVQNLPPIKDFKGWLIKPKEGNSTKLVYEASKNFSTTLKSSEELLQAFYSKAPIFHNDLEGPAFSLTPKLRELKENLFIQGAQSVFMTGSGTGLVALSENKPKFDSPIEIFEIHSIQRGQNEWYRPLKPF